MSKGIKKYPKIYALYKGENILADGTAEEIAEKLNLKVRTIYYYATKTNRKRIDQRESKQGMIAIPLEED